MKKVNDIAKQLWKAVEICSEPQLRELIKECESLTETNCWSLDYRLKDIISELAINQLCFRRAK